MVSDSVREPRHANVWFECEDLVSRLAVPIQVPDLHLQERQISQDLGVVGIEVKSLSVALDRLRIVLREDEPTIKKRWV